MLQFGVIVLTTANGILDHEEARRKKVGGKVLGRGYTSRTSTSMEWLAKRAKAPLKAEGSDLAASAGHQVQWL